MTSAKNYLLAFLLLLVVSGGALLWRQHLELVKLRAAALRPDERADWQKRLWASEKQRAELQAKVDGRRTAAESGSDETPDTAGPQRAAAGRNGRANFAAMMDNPEIQRLMAAQQKAGLDGRYAALFKALKLTPQQLDQFKNLLVEKGTAMMDVFAAARSQGINPRTDREAFDALIRDAQAEIDESIRSAIGDAAFTQYQQYEQTMPQRAVLSQLEQRLSYSSTPLTAQQENQMLQILATTAPTQGDPNSPRAVVAAFGGGRGPFAGAQASVTSATVNQALGVLAAPQVEALKEIQREQQAQAELMAAFRAQAQGNSSGRTDVRQQAEPVPPPPPPSGG